MLDQSWDIFAFCKGIPLHLASRHVGTMTPAPEGLHTYAPSMHIHAVAPSIEVSYSGDTHCPILVAPVKRCGATSYGPSRRKTESFYHYLRPLLWTPDILSDPVKRCPVTT